MAMKASTCEQRDGYLGKWLAGHERVEFEAHLANCPGCRQFVQEQQRLDNLLAQANAELLPVPAVLLRQIEHRLRKGRRWRLTAWVAALSAAAILACTFAAWYLANWLPKDDARQSPPLATPLHPPSQPPDPRTLVRVTFPSPSDVIAVPQKTENPSITIIWVYPTVKTAQEPNPAPADFFQPPERNGT